MKKTISLLLFVAIGTGFLSSCSDYLESDQYFKDRMNIEKAFSSKQYSEEWLAHTFSDLENECADVASKGYTPHCFADDMYYGDRDGDYDTKDIASLSYNEFHTGLYSENDKQDTWTQCYRGIRNATTFIQNIDINKEMTAEEIADYKAQARFVRAYYYWLLLRKYGPIPLLPEDGIDYTESYDDVATPRSSYEECADYIASELVLAAKDLAQGRDRLSIARPTRGAALATRAKVLLYAASPLANGNTDSYAMELVDDEGRQLLSTNYDEEKWAKAAAAAKDVMELGVYELYTASFRATGNSSYPATIVPPYYADFSENNWPEGWKDIDPFESYRSVFNGTVGADNPELIFTRGNNGGEKGQAMVAHQLPRVANGWNTHGITQKQCDAYYMNDGTDCPGKDKEIGRGDGSDRLSGYVTQEDLDAGMYKPLATGVSLQYADREPRFYASVAYNGSVWHLENEPDSWNKEKQVFYYRGDGNGYTNTMFWLRTGIGVMKFVHPRDTYRDGAIGLIVPKLEPAIRYAEVLLIYAEALNELTGTYNIPAWDGSATYAISRDVTEMKKGIRPIRIRSGVPDYTADVYADQDLFRTKLKRERQIELMGEGHRYYDLRRWKDAPVEESLPIYGCNILMTSEQKDLFHTPVAEFSLQSTFSRKMWFWPIKHSELKRNKRLTQNPGWTYND
ncbi:RagB/SusD family nutrient uptake outer membrane protein [Mangrovibacterium diazotrophicum]|uniref:Putative outer membrane starch-binding protein n=1 Tax=Mangrovibacterium diazotrophicum TaxID=1261403 RepID=A0A419W7B9_9BACT|nr:RagB/SusD family nutrient uptake outer membrane protein [Mangrovibacterium diazotrophicum]RKD91346.1 putative outer membrane starch-binding protein [Mangrovibacterium diazotrophicum]